jgi:hypothetical protein
MGTGMTSISTPGAPAAARGTFASRWRTMMRERPAFVLAASLFAITGMVAAAMLYIQPTMSAPLNIYDEGIIAFGAVRVLDGEIPHRDFWTQYSPGQLYTLAALFGLFGRTIMVERWWDVFTRGLLAVAIFLIAARLSSRRAAFAIWLLAVMWVTYYGFFGYPIFAGLCFSLFSAYALIRGLERPRWLWVSGALLGVAAIFRHDMAIYAAAAFTASLAGFAVTDPALAGASVRARAAHGLKLWLRLASSAALVVAPVLAYFVANVSVRELLDQSLIFPLTVFPKVRDLPYPKLDGSLEALPFYVPFVLYALATVVALSLLRPALRRFGSDRASRMAGESGSDRRDAVVAWGILAIAIFGLAGFNQARVRSDTIHTVQFYMPAALLLGVVLQRGLQVGRIAGYLMIVVGVVLYVGLLVNPVNQYLATLDARGNKQLQQQLARSLPVARGALMNDPQILAAHTLQLRVPPDEPIYIGLTRHDKVFANDAMMYFLAGRPSATRYHELHPGLTNTRQVQEEMIRDLERNRVRYILVTGMFEGANEPNDSAKSSGVSLLDDYIEDHYRSADWLSNYRLLKRIDGFDAAPAGQ